MVVPDKSILIQLVNFIITILVLNLLLFKPVRQVIKKRKDLMAEQMGSIEKFNEQAEVKVKDYEAALDTARREGVEVRSKFKDEGVSEETKILAAAGEEASGTLQGARAEIQQEMSAAMGKLKGEVDAYATKAAEKILG